MTLNDDEQRLLDQLHNDRYDPNQVGSGDPSIEPIQRRWFNLGSEHAEQLVRAWLNERAMEREARRFAQRHDEAFARVSDAIRASFVVDEDGTNEVLLP